MVDQSGFYVVDLDLVDGSPVRLTNTQVVHFAWSPDGRWVAFQARSRYGRDLPAEIILASIDGKQRRSLGFAQPLSQLAWADAHNVSLWKPESDREDIQVPADIVVRNNVDSSRRFAVVAVRQPGGVRFERLVGSASESVLSERRDAGRIHIEDVFPDGRLLVAVEKPEWRTEITDANGRTLVQLGRDSGKDAFTGTSVSRDGSFVVGYRSVPSIEGTEPSLLCIASSDGRWVTTMEGNVAGVYPKISRSTDLVAYLDPNSGKTEVAHLAPAPR